MSSRVGNWIIGLGIVVLFAGLCVLPGAMGKNADQSLLPVGACLFSLGAVLIAGGIYVKARALQSTPSVPVVAAPAPISRKVRSGCDLCGQEAPAVLCKVHQVNMCATCLEKHYDVRSCIYVPTQRRTGNKPNKVAQSKARGA